MTVCACLSMCLWARCDRQHYTVMLPSGLDVHTAMVVLDREVAYSRPPPACILLRVPWWTRVLPPLPCGLRSPC